jgi:hypothetical protein
MQGLDACIALAVDRDRIGVEKIGEANPVFQQTRCFANKRAMRASVRSCNQTQLKTNKQVNVRQERKTVICVKPIKLRSPMRGGFKKCCEQQ